jgi:hypothetical protein
MRDLGEQSTAKHQTMDEYVKVFANVLRPPWNYLVGIAAALLVVAPRLIDFRRSWLDLRLGQAQLEREKLRLEILKLRIDLQQLAQQQKLPEIARELEKVSTAPPSSVAPLPERRGVLWNLVAGYPRFGRPVMLFAQILLACLLMMFAASAVATPIVLKEDTRPDVSLVVSIFYAALAWLCYKGFVVTRSIRKELTTRQQVLAAGVPQAAAERRH